MIENIGEVTGLKPNVNDYLDLLFSHCIEPVLKQKQAFVSLISILSIAGVMVGVMALIVVIAVMNGFDATKKKF